MCLTRVCIIFRSILKGPSFLAFGPGQRALYLIKHYDSIVSNPLATRYVAQFMHRTGLLAPFQHAEQEKSDDESGDHEVMGQSPEDAGHYPMLANMTEEGESLSQQFEYTVPDWAVGPETA